MTLAIRSLVIGRGAFRLPIPDLELPSGRTLAVLGPNGAGKTTLLKTMAGLVAPAAGRVSVQGVDVRDAPAPRRAALAAYAPPPGELDAPLDALAMVRLGGAARGLATAESAREALARVGAAPLAARAFDRLSTGERQLVTLARLLVQNSRVCLLDEPVGALDPGRREHVAKLIADMRREDRIVAIATHELSVVRSADAVLWLHPSGRAELAPGPLDPDLWTDRYR